MNYVFNCIYTTFSNILLHIGNTDIGLQLLALVELPPFGMGVPQANFKQLWNMPVRNDKLIIWYKTWETQHGIVFKIEVENVLILPRLFIWERIISSTSAEVTGAKNN